MEFGPGHTRMPKKGFVVPLQYREGSTYTGVDESAAGQRPGITKQTVQLSYGVYKTLEAKARTAHAQLACYI